MSIWSMNPGWGISFRPSMSLVRLFDDPNLTLETLLDDQSLTNEFRSNNQRLISWLNAGHFYRLVDLVTLNCDLDQRKQRKFASTACELLSTDIFLVINMFFPATPHKEEYYEYAEVEVNDVPEVVPSEEAPEAPAEPAPEQPSVEPAEAQTEAVPTTTVRTVKMTKYKERPQLLAYLLQGLTTEKCNQTMLGYICKIVTNLFNKRQAQVLGQLFKGDLLSRFLPWMHSRSVAELLVKVLCSESSAGEESFRAGRVATIQCLAEALSDPTRADDSGHASYILIEAVLKIINVQNIVDSEAIVETYFEQIAPASLDCVSKGVNVLSNLKVLLALSKNEEAKLKRRLGPDFLEQLVKVSEQHLFHESQDANCFGITRYCALKILSNVFTDSPGFQQEWVLASKFNERLFRLAIDYEFNNIMQSRLLDLFDLFAESGEWLLANHAAVNIAVSIPVVPHTIDKAQFTRGFSSFAYKLVKYIEETPELAAEAARRPEYQAVRQEYFEKYGKKAESRLGGYKFKKDNEAPVIFLSKAEALQSFHAFLSTPFKVIEEVVEVQTSVESREEEDKFSSHNFWRLSSEDEEGQRLAELMAVLEI